MDILKYIERRQLGFRGIGKSVHDIFIDKMGVVPSKINYDIDARFGRTFACKFSRNKPNLHVFGYSTECGIITIQNTSNHFLLPDQEVKDDVQRTYSTVHENPILNFAWAEPQMKLVTACTDRTSKLCSLDPSGKLVQEKEFEYCSPVNSVMFCPGYSDIFCAGSECGSLKLWDARTNNNQSVWHISCNNVPGAHSVYTTKQTVGVSSVIFKDDQTVISSSWRDTAIKVWDLRKSYGRVNMNTESYPLKEYLHPLHPAYQGFTDIILNPQATHLYACSMNDVIYCFELDSTERAIRPICQYTGHRPMSMYRYSKISIGNDGRYLFSGCFDQIGVLWLTNTPHIEKPAFRLCSSPKLRSELFSSDWCADSSCLKMVGSSESVPVVLSVLTDEQRHLTRNKILKFYKTPMYTSKLYSKKLCTAPIKFDVENEEKYKKQTEKNMENW